MSPRSPNGRRRKGKGAKAPNSALPPGLEDLINRLAKRVDAVECSQFLRAKHTLDPGPAVGDLESSLLPRNRLAEARPTTAPPNAGIKPRLEDLINRMSSLTQRIDNLSHVVAGDTEGAPQEVPTPFTIPDQLGVLEDLLTRASQRLQSIAERF